MREGYIIRNVNEEDNNEQYVLLDAKTKKTIYTHNIVGWSKIDALKNLRRWFKEDLIEEKILCDCGVLIPLKSFQHHLDEEYILNLKDTCGCGKVIEISYDLYDASAKIKNTKLMKETEK